MIGFLETTSEAAAIEGRSCCSGWTTRGAKRRAVNLRR
jgi:hypothetical protein